MKNNIRTITLVLSVSALIVSMITLGISMREIRASKIENNMADINITKSKPYIYVKDISLGKDNKFVVELNGDVNKIINTNIVAESAKNITGATGVVVADSDARLYRRSINVKSETLESINCMNRDSISIIYKKDDKSYKNIYDLSGKLLKSEKVNFNLKE